MFPPAPSLGKPAKVDSILTARRFTKHSNGSNKQWSSEEYNVKVPAGSIVVMDILAAQMNRKPVFFGALFGFTAESFSRFYIAMTWGEDVYDFRPERFIDTDTYRWPREACESSQLNKYSCSHKEN